MKKIILLTLIASFLNVNAYAVEEKKCNELEGFKKMGKSSIEYVNCLSAKVKSSSKFKLNTKSTLTDWITGKKKISDSTPNPITGLKNIGKALKPDMKPLKR